MKNNKSESEFKQNRKTIDHKLCAVLQTYFNNFLRENSQVTFKMKSQTLFKGYSLDRIKMTE